MQECLICRKPIKKEEPIYDVKDVVLITEGVCHKECGDNYKGKSLACYEVTEDGTKINIPREISQRGIIS